MKNKIDYFSYMKLIGAFLLIAPIEFIFWRFEYSILVSFLIVFILNIAINIFGVLLLNYLENGNCFKLIRYEY